MTTLSTLRNEIKADLVITGTDYDAQIDSKIRSALRLLRGHRLWFLKTTTTSVLTGSGVTSTSLSATLTDFAVIGTVELSSGGLWRGDGTGLDHVSYERLKQDYWNDDPIPTGTPEACALVGSTLYYSHTTAASYTLRLTYYRKDATLPSGDEGTSIWFDEGYDAVRSLALLLVKREVQQMSREETVNDEAMATAALNSLYEEHNNRESGRA